MSNSWDEMRRAKEEEYFQRKNREALERLAKKKEEKPRLSPVTGEPLQQEVLHGIVIDRCVKSGGIWLDAGELEQMLEAIQREAAAGGEQGGSLFGFFKSLSGK